MEEKIYILTLVIGGCAEEPLAYYNEADAKKKADQFVKDDGYTTIDEYNESDDYIRIDEISIQ